jgi:hypothetical protein
MTDFPKDNQGVRQALINSDRLLNPLVTMDGKRETKICRQAFLVERMGIEKIRQELTRTLGDDACGLNQIKIWLKRFRTGDLSCSNFPRAGRPPIALGPQFNAFLQKYPFASSRIITKHFLTTASTVKEILQREFSRRWVPYSLRDAQKVARVKVAKEMLRILQESETHNFDSITTGDESWFQHTMVSSKMFVRLAADIIPRTRHVVGAKEL